MKRLLLMLCLLFTTGCGPSTSDDGSGVLQTSASSPNSSATSESSKGDPIVGATPVPDDAVVVVLATGEVAALRPDGSRGQRFGVLPPGAGMSVDVSPDRRTVLVSDVTSQEGTCDARVLMAQPGGTWRTVLSGAAGARFSADGSQVAYKRYALVGEYCSQVDLVVQQVSTGTRRTVALPGGSELVSNPPQFPINWSPDGKRLAFAHAGAVQVVDVATLTTTSIGAHTDATATRGTFAPVFTARGDLAVLTGCCVAPMTVDTVDEGTRARTTLFAVTAPVRSISRDHRDEDILWLTLEEAGLFRWDGERLAAVATPGSLPLLVSG